MSAPPSSVLLAELAMRGPYPGLVPYSRADAMFFFGREREARIITANLRATRLTLLYGASGVGKSSVLLAGVVRELEELAEQNLRELETAGEAGARADFAISVLSTWVDEPLALLMDGICRSAEKASGRRLEPWRPGASVLATLEAWTEHVQYLLVVLDQFEEYFLYHPPSTEEGSFDVEFVRILNAPQLRVNVLVSLREDALSQLDRFKSRISGLYDNYLRIDHLDRDAAEDAIRKPVETYNRLCRDGEQPVTVEPELVEAVLDAPDLRAGSMLLGHGEDAVPELQLPGTDGHIETPYLQLVMTRLWREETTNGSLMLRTATLARLGGPKQIVRSHLREAMDALSPKERDLAADVLHHLVTPARTKIALTAFELAGYVSRPEAEIEAILATLSGASRILRAIEPPPRPVGAPPGPAGGVRYEIFHDALADAVLDWRAEHQALREREEADRAARAEREESERVLKEQIATQEQEKLAAQEHARREQARARKERRRALLSMALAGAAVLALIAVGVLGYLAVQQRDRARAQELAARATAELDLDPAESVRLALQAVGARSTPQAELALRQALAESRLRAVIPLDEWVTAAAFSSDGTNVATASSDEVTVWDWRSRRLVAGLPHTGVARATFAPSGGTLASIGGRSVLFWDLSRCSTLTCTSIASISSKTGFAYAASFSPDGRRVLTAIGEWLQVWDVAACLRGSCKETRRFIPSRSRWVYDATFVPGRDLVATASSDGKVRVWDIGRGNPKRPLRVLSTENIGFLQGLNVAVSRNGRYLAAAEGTAVWVWDLAACLERKQACAERILPHPNWVNGVSFGPGALLGSSSEDGVARIWDLATAGGNTLVDPLELRGHSDVVFEISFSPDARYAVTASADGDARVWDLGTDVVLRGHKGMVNVARYSATGDRILTAGRDGSVRVWDAETSSQVAVVPVGALVWSADFSRDGRQVVTGDTWGRVKLWSVARCTRRLCTPTRSFPKSAYSAELVDVSPRSDLMLKATSYGEVVLQSMDGPRKVALLAGPGQITSAGFSDNGKYVLTTGVDRYARIWDVSACDETLACRPSLLRALAHPGVVYGAAVSAESPPHHLVTGAGDRVVRIWDLQAGEYEALELVGHTRNIRTVAFSPDGRYVVSGGADRTVRIWDSETGEQLTVRKYSASMGSVAFAPRGDGILVAGDDGAVRIFQCGVFCESLDKVRAEAEAISSD